MKNIFVIQFYVVFGYVGNSVVEFLMCCLGVNVWFLNIVQFFNYMQYGKWIGCVMLFLYLMEIVQGIVDIDKLQICDVVLSGYFGFVEQGEYIFGIVCQVKVVNLVVKYFCDLVMGYLEKGCIVVLGVVEFYVCYVLLVSDIIVLNLVELEILCGYLVVSVSEVVVVVWELIVQGLEVVLVKYFVCVGLSMDCFEMLLVMVEEVWYISWLLVDFGLCQLVGVGDVISGLLLVKLLQGVSLCDVLEYVIVVVYEIMFVIKNMQEYELQVVVVQDCIVVLEYCFSVIWL